MKIILTGSTGFIGHEVLEQCLRDSRITSVVALLRRDLPQELKEANPKLKTVIMTDFTIYSEDVLSELDGADACLWSLGKAMVESDEEARRMTLDYTLAAVESFQSIYQPQGGRKFRFIYLSGKISERDQTKTLWYMQEHRRIRGLLEVEIIKFAEEHKDEFETYIVKPSMVLSTDKSLLNCISSTLIPTVKVDVLAAVMVNLAIGGRSQQTFENSDINDFCI